MKVVSVEQARRHRLRAHHLDRAYGIEDAAELAGACGMQNTPPGAWETALFNRAPACRREDAERLLYGEKTLVQAWSLRGAPVVFPAAESAAFLSALVPAKGEPWAYTKGIGLALDALGMEFDRLLELLVRAMPRLDDEAIASKVALDQTLADWVEPLLPANKRAAWRQPSMYGSPDKQTVGGAAVSFLLRPCSFMGLVVFGERAGATPTFTSYRRWTGAQARRMWKGIADELEPVEFGGKKAWALAADLDALASAEPPEREVLLLAGHDPYLDQRDRATLQVDVSLQRRIWKTVANPGVVVRNGEAVGTWTAKKKGAGLSVSLATWVACSEQKLRDLAEAYAAFRGLKLLGVSFE